MLPLAVRAAPCAAQETPLTADSILVLLTASRWQIRYEGLTALAELSSVPTELRSRLVALARQEAVALATRDSMAEPDSEGYGEYVTELALALGRLREPLCASDLARLGGLQVTTSIQLFVAAQGGTVLGVLDSLYNQSIPDAASVLETWAMMLSRSPDRLTLNQLSAVQGRVARGATHESEAVRLTFLDAARRAPFPAFWPLVDRLATSDPFRDVAGHASVQEEATSIANLLYPLWTALPRATIVDMSTDILGEACRAATGSAKGHCVAATAQWESAKRHLASGNREALLAALASYRRSVRAVLSDAGISEASATLLLAYADRVEQLS